MSIAAKSMNMNMAEFTKAMEDGRLSAVEFMPAFTKAMRQMAAPGLDKAFKSMQVSFNKMVQNGKLLIDAIFQSGVGELFTQIFNSLSDIFAIMRPIMSFLFGFMSAFIKAVIFPIRLAIALVADLVDLVSKGFQSAFGTSLDSAMAKIGNFFGFLTSIFTGVFNVVGKIVTGIGKFFGNISPTLAIAKKFPGASETIGKAASKTAEVAGAIGRSTYTKVGGVGAASTEAANSEISTRVYVEATGELKDYMRQNEREKPRTTMSTNVRG